MVKYYASMVQDNRVEGLVVDVAAFVLTADQEEKVNWEANVIQENADG